MFLSPVPGRNALVDQKDVLFCPDTPVATLRFPKVDTAEVGSIDLQVQILTRKRADFTGQPPHHFTGFVCYRENRVSRSGEKRKGIPRFRLSGNRR